MTEVWFRYRDDNGKSYYYSSSTHQTTWKFPSSGSVWDAVSKRKLRLPGQTKSRPPAPPPQAPKPPASDEDEDYENSSEEGSENSESSGPAGPNVPDYTQELIEKWSNVSFDFSQFESEKMNKLKKDKFENSDKPLDTPLLQECKKNDSKLALRNYKILLKHSGITIAKGLKGETITDLFTSLDESDALVNELYVDLWKQTTNCKKDMLTLLLDLFLVLVTCFLPDEYLYVPILKHLAGLAKSDNYAKFVLIRFNDLVARDQPFHRFKSEDDIEEIHDQYKKGTCCFIVSQYECFYNQKVKRPTAPIPFIQYHLLENIKQQGGRDKANIFRSAGNKKQLEALIIDANEGKDVVEGQSVDDVCALFKKWIELIPGRLISENYKDQFQKATGEDSDPDTILDFANSLPNSVQAILKYLVGYLRDFAQNSQVTQMGLGEFAAVFGGIITFEDDDADPIKFKQSQEYFMKTILESWDIGDAYPIAESMMKAKK